jgi:hypothetical protein
MSKLSILLPLLLILSPLKTFALTELDFNFGYDKTVFGSARENSVVRRSYSGAITFYFTEFLGLEFNGASSKEITTIEENRTIGSDLEEASRQEIVESEVYGAGLRIMLASRKSFLIPTISVGYARAFNTSGYDILILVPSSGLAVRFKEQASKYRTDNAFGAFALKLKLTKTLALRGSIRTYFPADDFNKAKDNLRYSAGFSWFF